MTLQDEWFAHVAGCHQCELRGVCEIGLAIIKRGSEQIARQIVPDPPEPSEAPKS